MMVMSVDAERRFWSKVNKEGPIPDFAPHLGPCWVWTAAGNRWGYGVYTVNGRQKMAHRWAYRLTVGEIPDGLQLDHLCRVRRCIRPSHLETGDLSRELVARRNLDGESGRSDPLQARP